MKNILFASVLFFSILTIHAQQKSNVLIDDFEDGNNQNNLGGYWYSFNDNIWLL
jgi:licheninase